MDHGDYYWGLYRDQYKDPLFRNQRLRVSGVLS